MVEYKGYEYGIRKITPRESWRLMGWGKKNDDGTWDDTDFEKAEAVASNSRLYKAAGNGIVVPVLEAVFSNMFKR